MEASTPSTDPQRTTPDPIPKGSRSFRASVDTSVLQQDQEMWKRARLFVRNITSRYTNYANQPIDIFERDLHNLWYLFIGAAKVTPTDEAAADRLAIQVLVAREMGLLRRLEEPGTDEKAAHISEAANGAPSRMWVDLPFLATDLREAWKEAMTGRTAVPSNQLANLGGFTARLVAFGVCEVELSQCGLLLLREALETPRPILPTDSADQKDIPLSHFMPALSAWLRHGSYKLLGLCARGHASASSTDDAESPEDQWVTAGPLLSTLSPEQRSRTPGFSMTRWEFWKQRLAEVAGDHGALEDTVQGQARHCFGFLDSWERITGGDGHDREIARKAYYGIE
ncbi:hypothetical protein M436DRAFT_80116 [Aureobasidium namibiae CBS 147.97]|uniref:Uncharacterized protein n=1 Tax=Aureobasidium namibiae CBS 147.97 TaxID=1043004 RepID=A0A074WW30_9PEZI